VRSEQIHNDALLRSAVWLLFGATLLIVIYARMRLLDLPLERDEGEYAYSGQLLLQGIPPYKLAYSMKFPGTSVAYAVLMSIFGSSIRGIHLGLILINLITIGLVFFLGRRLFDELGAIAAAAAYSVLSLMPHVLGQAAHATHFVALFAVAGVFQLICALDRQSSRLIFASGCSFGIALLMKQPGLLFVLFGSIYLLSSDWRRHLDAKKIVSRNVLYLCGAAVPCLLTAFALWFAGVFGKFWFWTITYAAQYGARVSLTEGLQVLAEHFRGPLRAAWPFWAIAATAVIGLIACFINPTVQKRAGFLVAFVFFSALAVCPGLYFRPHYFIVFLPAVSLLAGASVVAGLQPFATRARNFRIVLVLIFAVCVAWPLWSERDFFFKRPLAEANRLVNGTNPFPESIKIAQYIREQSQPGETIGVLGSEPQIYFYSQRSSATGYIYTYGLMEPQPYAHQMQQEMIREIETARPKFLVLVVVSKSWLAGRDSDQFIFRWADRYCDAYYEEVGLVNISDQGTVYYFSGRPANGPPAPEHILIYRRKA